MCIGMHLALAEMALVPALYRRYSSRIKPGFEDVTPGITSRFEVFYDETLERMEVGSQEYSRSVQAADYVLGTYLLDSIQQCAVNLRRLDNPASGHSSMPMGSKKKHKSTHHSSDSIRAFRNARCPIRQQPGLCCENIFSSRCSYKNTPILLVLITIVRRAPQNAAALSRFQSTYNAIKDL